MATLPVKGQRFAVFNADSKGTIVSTGKVAGKQTVSFVYDHDISAHGKADAPIYSADLSHWEKFSYELPNETKKQAVPNLTANKTVEEDILALLEPMGF